MKKLKQLFSKKTKQRKQDKVVVDEMRRNRKRYLDQIEERERRRRVGL